MRDSPFGMDECCICDAPATHAGETEEGERLPYCQTHLDEVLAQFPDTPVSLLRAEKEVA